MADRYWVGGSGNWSDTARWSTSSGGSGGASVPTSADNVIFDAASNVGTGAFTVTVDGTASTPSNCLSFSTGGAGGALDGAMTLAFGSTGYLYCYGSMTFPATNFSISNSGSFTTAIVFASTTTGNTFTTNGVTVGNSMNIIFNGAGGGWTLGSALTTTNAGLQVENGSFNTGNYNFTGNSLSSQFTVATRSITLGSSTITVTGAASPVLLVSGGTLTLSAGTSTITLSNASPNFLGGGLTFYNVSFTSAAAGTVTINGANTFNNLTFTSRNATGIRQVGLAANQIVNGTLTLGAANTAIRRIYVVSSGTGIQRTITLNGTLATLADVDFKDINAAGTVATPWTGTRLGDALNNSNITFDAPKTVYWNLAGTQNWSATGWATTNNGTPAVNNFPLPQDTAVFTEAGAAGTVTLDASWWIGNLQMADGVSNRTTAFTLATGSQVPQIFGSVTLFSNLTLTGTATLLFRGSGVTQTLTSAGISFPQAITIDSSGGTVQLLDNTTVSNTVTLTQGTLDLSSGNRTLTCVAFSSSNSNTRSITFGTGNITVTGNNATIWTTSTSTGFTTSGTQVVNCTYSGSTGTRTIVNAAAITEANQISFNISAGSDTVAINTGFRSLNFTGFTGTLTNVARTLFGNLTLSSGMTVNAGTAAITFAATSGTQQITTNGQTLDFPIIQNNPGSTLQLQDNLTIGSTRTFTLTAGTLDLSSGNRTLSCGLFSAANSNTRAIAFGTGNITLTGNNATIWTTATATGLTYTGTSTVNCTYSGAVGTRTIFGGNPTVPFNFNISAGTDIVSIGGNAAYRDINFTGFSGTLSAATSARSIAGNLILSSGMSTSSETGGLQFVATSGTQQLTTNGKTLDFPITINGVGGTVELQDALTMGSTRTLTLTNGTLNANNKNVTVGDFISNNSNTRVLTMGSGTWTIQDSGTSWDIGTATGMTLNRGTSTITMTSTSAKTFAGGGLTYYKLNQGGTGTLTLTGANTFYDMTNTVQPCTITFPASTTTSFSNFNVKGTSGNLVSLRSSSPGTQYTLAKIA